MRPLRLLTFAALSVSPLLSGCHGGKGKDSHVDAFQTIDQARAQRLGQQRAGWQELAVQILAADRPGVTAKAEETNSVHIEADGVSRSVSLVPVYEDLASHMADERGILRKLLAEQLRSFDTERLRALGFDAVKAHLYPMLVNGKRVEELRAAAVDPKDPPPDKPLFTNLHRITVVRWEKFGVIPVSPRMLGEKVTQADVDAAAMEALRKSFLELPEPKIELIDFGPLGHGARLNPRGDAAMVLLPEFAAAARAALGGQGDLVLMMPMAHQVDVARRKDEKLLDRWIPMSRQIAAKADEPLCDQPVLLNDEGLSLFSYTPATQATQPASKPAATAPAVKPHAHIVR